LFRELALVSGVLKLYSQYTEPSHWRIREY